MSRSFSIVGCGVASVLLLGLVCPALAQSQPAAPNTVRMAAEIDALLAKEHYGGEDPDSKPVRQADDETFLRRVSLDLVGAPPTPQQVIAFAIDPSPIKRTEAVERLLADKHYGQNWARYWRDVIFARRKEDRSLLAAPALLVWLTDELNRNTHWDTIARQFITAVGDIRENGATGLIMAQSADPADTTAEVSRIFLGIQIQCAQCHNHPTDRWKREQFHQLAAFFPRIGIRPDLGGEKRSFQVVSLNRPHQKRMPGAPDDAELEHYMPDLNHPDKQGTLMSPIFFATGQKLELGLNDRDRREKLAFWLTASGDRWFAKALVNRLWAELVGHGFFDPVDDMGPDREPIAPQAFEALSAGFAANHYDIKWLLRVITSTQAYQRESRSRHAESAAPMASSCPQRLRSDQLFNVLCDALEIDETALRGGGGGGGPLAQAYGNGPRGQVARTFGYDPSVRRDEVAGSIPQALWMMNSGELNRAISARSSQTMLGRLLAETKDNKIVLMELYLRTLAREPKPHEVTTCLDYLAAHPERAAAFEDILWSLVNSTEFLHRK